MAKVTQSAAPPPLRHFSQSLPMLLLRGREAVMRHFRVLLRDYELTEQQWRVLRALSGLEEVEVSELARVTYLLAPSLSRIVRDLEQRGLMTRRTDKVDLRLGLVRITRAGRQLIHRISPHSETIYGLIAERFGDRKLQTLEALLCDLEAAMSIGAAQGDEAGKPKAPRVRARSS